MLILLLYYILGFRSRLSTPFSLTTGQAGRPTGWTISDVNFNSNGATDRDTVITADGIYFVSFTPVVSGVTSGFRASININGTAFLLGRISYSSATPSTESMPLSLAMNLRKNDVLTYEVIADNAGITLDTLSTRSLLQVDIASSNLTEGMSGIKTASSSYSSGENTITGWDMKDTPGTFLAKNVSVTSVGTLVVLRAGVFRVTAHIIVSNNINTRR